MISSITVYLSNEEDDTIKKVIKTLEEDGAEITENRFPYDFELDAEYVQDLESLEGIVNAIFPELKTQYIWNPNEQLQTLYIGNSEKNS